MYFVYIAKSLKDNGFYTEKYFSAEEAYKREKQIKSYKGGEAFKKLINNSFQSGGVA